MTSDAITPFRIDVPQADLDDLRDRLARTRWPDPQPSAGWEYGIPLDYVRELAEYWRTGYDWRPHEAKLNEYDQFTTEIDSAKVHFLHVRSAEPAALPLLVTHGWPGSVAEFLKIIGPLNDPAAHGGDPADAFHLVIPSMPGYGFSGPTREPGWHIGRVANALGELMHRLGYERFGTHGGDWGSYVAREVGVTHPNRVIGAHLTMINAAIALAKPTESDLDKLTEAQRAEMTTSYEQLARFRKEGQGYAAIQGTKPQTLAYGLVDSPAGQLAWITEKFKEWTDSQDRPEDAVDRDQLLTNVSIYWFTGTAGSAARLYYETMHSDLRLGPGSSSSTVPTGVAVFPHEIAPPVRHLAERKNKVVRWTNYDHGGHFAAMEQPEILVEDIRALFRQLR